MRMSVRRGHESRKTSILQKVFSALGAVTVFLALWYCWFLPPSGRHSSARDSFSTNISAAFDSLPGGVSDATLPAIYAPADSGHAVFPYSVIPGGIRSGQ